MDIVENTIRLYKLLRNNRRRLTWDEAKDRLGLSSEEMGQAVDLLNEAYDNLVATRS